LDPDPNLQAIFCSGMLAKAYTQLSIAEYGAMGSVLPLDSGIST
jgi:hypothetical protein